MHHAYPGAHWTDHPRLQSKHWEELVSRQGTIFRGTHTFEIFGLVLFGNLGGYVGAMGYNVLRAACCVLCAACYVLYTPPLLFAPPSSPPPVTHRASVPLRSLGNVQLVGTTSWPRSSATSRVRGRAIP